MNKKGFTLVEMLGILVVLSIIVVISVPAITGSLKRARQEKYDNWLKSLYIAAEEYTESHREEFYEVNAGATSYLSIQLLLDQGYLKESVVDPESGRDITEVAIIKITVNSDKTLKYELIYKDDLDLITISVGVSPDPAVETWTSSDVTLTVYAEASTGIRVDEYSFDGGATWQSSNKKTFNKNQTVTVVARDSRFNQQSNKKTVTISHIDKTAPSVANTIVNLVTTKSITVKAECADAESGISGYQFSKDNGSTWTEVRSGSSYKFDNLTTGTYKLKTRCINGAKLKKDSATVSKNTQNLVVPTCTISPSSGWTKTKTARFSFPAGDANNKFTYSYSLVKGKGTAGGTSLTLNKWVNTTNLNQEVVLTSTDSSSQASVIARVSDGVNTVSGSSCTASYVDSAAPAKPSVTLKLNNSGGGGYSSGSWTNKNVYHYITSSDVGSGASKYQYSHDNKTWIDLPTSWPSYSLRGNNVSYVINWGGNWNFYVRLIDKAGNVSASSNVFTVRIDKTPPTCSSSGGSSAWAANSRTLVGTCYDSGGSGCKGNVRWLINWSGEWYNLSPGTVYDNAGNSVQCPANQTVKVDTTNPWCTNSGDSTSWATSRTIYWGCGDDRSGCSGSGSKRFTAGATVTTATIAGYTVTNGAGRQTWCPARTAKVYVRQNKPVIRASCGNNQKHNPHFKTTNGVASQWYRYYVKGYANAYYNQTNTGAGQLKIYDSTATRLDWYVRRYSRITSQGWSRGTGSGLVSDGKSVTC